MCAATPRTNARILILSADMPLSESRKAVLEHAGWQVAVSRNKQHALAMLHNESFDLLIFCNSLSSSAVAEFAAIFRGKNDHGRLLGIVDRRSPEIDVDDVLLAPVRPAELLEAVRHLLPST